jgi:chemotaxis protein MotB
MRSPLSRNVNPSAELLPSLRLKPLPERSTFQVSGDDANWWMITLSDLTLLLLGFLVVWYATEKRIHPTQQPPAVVESVVNQPSAIVTPLGKSPQSEEWRNFEDEMRSFIAEAGLSKDVSVESTKTDVLVSLSDTVPFASGKAEISAPARAVLDKVASLALGQPTVFLEITGHTDSIPIATGMFPSNWELSAARASRVARYLIEKGIDPSRIAVQGYANQRPKLPEFSPAMRRANRRVELRLYHGTGTVSLPESGAPTS